MSEESTADTHVVIMGVSGCGKSTLAMLVAEKTGSRFLDADDLHSQENIVKMSAGVPLTDDDRWTWLHAIAHAIENSDESLIVACSALRRGYRDIIRNISKPVLFVHLHGDKNLLVERLDGRKNHFASKVLLDSQLDTLEHLQSDELGDLGIVLDIALPNDRQVEEVIGHWNKKN